MRMVSPPRPRATYPSRPSGGCPAWRCSWPHVLLLAITKRADAEAQGAEVDEALGVALAVHLVGLEGDEVRAIQRSRGSPAGDRDRAFVELESHGAGDVALNLVDQALQGQALRCEPEPVIDHLRVARNQGIAQVQHLAIQRERLDRPVSRVQNGATGRLVDPAGLHADEAIFHEVDAADAML